MNRSMCLVVALAAPAAGPAWCGPEAEGVADEGEYARVEVRGRLLPGPEADGGRPSAPIVRAGELVFELEFEGEAPSAEAIGAFFERTVVVRGLLQRRPGREHLVCVVEGEIRPGAEMQYLVGYQEGQESAIESLCKRLGLRVVGEPYKPGGYLVVEPTDEATAGFVERLKGDKAVRYVEPNETYRIPPGEVPGAGRVP